MFRRRESVVIHVAGLAVAIGGLGMLAAAIVETIDGGTETVELYACAAGSGAVGFAMNRWSLLPPRIDTRSVFSAVTAAWVALAVASSVLYLVTGTFSSFADGMFESISGFTTTGASVLDPIEGTPAGVLFWRSTTQWLGGMGVIVLVVAVLPLLGVGGMELLAAEAPGPSDERLTPRVRYTAQRLWAVYVGFTVAIVIAYLAGGMSVFDAVNHSFTTISTGGFSTHDASFAHFDSAYLEWAAVVSMFAAGASFTMYWRALRGKPFVLFRSPEARVYLLLVLTVTGVALVANRSELGLGHDAIRDSLFTVVSIASTTGYVLVDYTRWAVSPQVLLLVLMGIGAMAGSTAGGFKVVRTMAIGGYARRELLRALHPRMVRPVRVGRNSLDERIVSRIMGFLVLFLGTILVGTVVMAAFGEDIVTSLSATTSAIGNVGPALGTLGDGNFSGVDLGTEITATVVMLLGRLEIFPVLLAFAALPRWWAHRDHERRAKRALRH
ncbi:MAG: TrkH family potassium uptake protein [Acidimicrobiia bacterium]|nr:TrkH family potassium uptake protein [Acidimicrobiia bacterium]